MNNFFNNRSFKELLDAIPEDQKAAFELNYGVATRLYAVLTVKGITPHELAQRLGKEDNVINEWLTGRHDFTLSTIAEIETSLGCSLLNTPQLTEDIGDFDVVMDEHLGKPGSPEREAFRREARDYIKGKRK